MIYTCTHTEFCKYEVTREKKIEKSKLVREKRRQKQQKMTFYCHPEPAKLKKSLKTLIRLEIPTTATA